MNILLVEDDKELRSSLTEFLKAEGYNVCGANGQREAYSYISEMNFDCILLDISLGDGNGFSICAHIRGMSDVPIVFLTASGDEASTVAGLELGADDYITKPFRPRELAARIKSVIRRKRTDRQELSLGNIRIDTAKGAVFKAGEEIFLSALEYRLLLLFASNKGVLFSRDKLIDELWTVGGEFVNDNTLTVYIKRLREKIEDDPQNPLLIKTVRGLGYKAEEQ
ncbi:MAG: response regulator transcription factor [Ruminococcaceae bacterium]|nr:response regulator transcription factor [Oscillospiraceae bacterium]